MLRTSQVGRRLASALLAVTAAVAAVPFGGAAALAAEPAPLLPSGEQLYSVGYSTPKVGLVSTVDAQVTPRSESIGDATLAEGAGFDAFTGRTFIMQDCEIFVLKENGAVQSLFEVATANGIDPSSCWGFTTVGDGTAFVSGRFGAIPDVTTGEESILRISLTSGEVIGERVVVKVANAANSLGLVALDNAYKFEPVDLAYNSTSAELWAVGYGGYVFRLNPSTGAIDRIFDGFTSGDEWSWGMAVDSNNVLWLNEGDSGNLVSLEPDQGWARSDLPQMTFAGEPWDTDAMWIQPAPPMASGSTVYLTTDCTKPLSVIADVGDTIVIEMQQPGCNGTPFWDEGAGNYANFNNLNGTYFNDVEADEDNDASTPDTKPYQGTATGSGFLKYVSHTQSTIVANDYWGKIARGSQDDWYVMQTRAGGENVVITMKLLGEDGTGAILRPGSTLGVIFTEPADWEPVEFRVTYAGPRTVSPGVSASALAATGADAFGLTVGSALTLLLGLATVTLLRRRRVQRSRSVS